MEERSFGQWVGWNWKSPVVKRFVSLVLRVCNSMRSIAQCSVSDVTKSHSPHAKNELFSIDSLHKTRGSQDYAKMGYS